MPNSRIHSLKLLHQGKVRDIYELDEKTMLIVTSDRLSAFDVILPDELPGKGALLNQISNFWFKRFESVIPNQLTDFPLEDVLTAEELQGIEGQYTIVKRLKALPVEAIVRGYLIGSGWNDYQKNQAVCGIALPAGLRLAEQLPETLFTPSTKAAVGDHDENISFEQVCELIGDDLASQLKNAAIRIYQQAAEYALERGIIIADTKFEFGVDDQGTLHLIDEVLTPDSSRFWEKDEYQVGSSPKSFDKQFVRDYLNTLDWDKNPPGPKLPQEIIDKTVAKYQEVVDRLQAS